MRFHDGREMTSDDVAFTFRRFLDPAFVSGRKGAYRDLAAVDVARSLHRRVSAEGAVGVVSRSTWSMGIVPAGTGADGGAPPDRQRAVPARRVRARRPRRRCAAFDGYYRGTPEERRAHLQGRARRDDARPGTAQGRRRPRRQRPRRPTSSTASRKQPALCGRDRRPAPTTRTSGSTCAIRSSQDRAGAPGDRLRHRPRGHRPLPAPRPGARDDRHRAVDVVGLRATTCFAFTHDLDTARRRCSTRPAIPIRMATARAPRLRLTLKTSTAEAYRVQAAVHPAAARRGRHRARAAVVRVRDADCRRHPRQRAALHAAVTWASPIRTCCAACSTRRRCRPTASTAPLPQPRGRSADRRGDGGARRDRTRAATTSRRSGSSPPTRR